MVRKVTPRRDDYLRAPSEVLGGWVSPEDVEARRDLRPEGLTSFRSRSPAPLPALT